MRRYVFLPSSHPFPSNAIVLVELTSLSLSRASFLRQILETHKNAGLEDQELNAEVAKTSQAAQRRKAATDKASAKKKGGTKEKAAATPRKSEFPSDASVFSLRFSKGLSPSTALEEHS